VNSRSRPSCRSARLALVVGLVSATAVDAWADAADLFDSEAGRQAVQIALETKESGTVFAWRSHDGALSGQVTPHRTFRTTDGVYCREYAETITDGLDTLKRVHMACRNTAGHWQIVEE